MNGLFGVAGEFGKGKTRPITLSTMKNTPKDEARAFIIGFLAIGIVLGCGYLIALGYFAFFDYLQSTREPEFFARFKTEADCKNYIHNDFYYDPYYTVWKNVPPICKPVHDEKLRREQVARENEAKANEQLIKDFKEGKPMPIITN